MKIRNSLIGYVAAAAVLIVSLHYSSVKNIERSFQEETPATQPASKSLRKYSPEDSNKPDISFGLPSGFWSSDYSEMARGFAREMSRNSQPTQPTSRPYSKPEPKRQDFFSNEPMDHSEYAKGIGQRVSKAYENFPFGHLQPETQPAYRIVPKDLLPSSERILEGVGKDITESFNKMTAFQKFYLAILDRMGILSQLTQTQPPTQPASRPYSQPTRKTGFFDSDRAYIENIAKALPNLSNKKYNSTTQPTTQQN